MTQEQIFNKVQDIIADKLGCDKENVTPEAQLGTGLYADSLDYVGMVMDAEKVFGIVIPDDQIYFKETVTVKECCEELEKIINKQ